MIEQLNFMVYLMQLVPTINKGRSFGPAAVTAARLSLDGSKEL